MATGTNGANILLNYMAAGGSTAAGLWVSLHTAAPGATGANELTTGTAPGYARQVVTFGAASGAAISNSNAPVFTATSAGAWAAVNYAMLWDAVTGGNCFMSTALDPTVTAGTVSSGGTGYVSGDVGKTVTVSGGTVQTGFSAATFTISSVSGGAVTGITLANSNQYVAGSPPSSPAATSGGGTTGSGLTITLTTSTSWTLSASSTLTIPTGTLTFAQN